MKNSALKLIPFLKKHKLFNCLLSKIFNFVFTYKKRNGKNNIIKTNNSYFYKCQFKIKGSNNVIEFDELCLFKKAIISISGNNNCVKIGKNVKGNYVDVCIQDNNNSLLVGDNTYFAGNIHIAITEGKKVEIGRDCLFSNSIVIRTGDSHSVLDIKTKERVNNAKDVYIKDHVWVTERVTLLKGAAIEENSIIASNSIVTKKNNQKNVIIGGFPAKILKENITWDINR